MRIQPDWNRDRIKTLLSMLADEETAETGESDLFKEFEMSPIQARQHLEKCLKEKTPA